MYGFFVVVLFCFISYSCLLLIMIQSYIFSTQTFGTIFQFNMNVVAKQSCDTIVISRLQEISSIQAEKESKRTQKYGCFSRILNGLKLCSLIFICPFQSTACLTVFFIPIFSREQSRNKSRRKLRFRGARCDWSVYMHQY